MHSIWIQELSDRGCIWCTICLSIVSLKIKFHLEEDEEEAKEARKLTPETIRVEEQRG